jgi:hypothetical protein
MDSEYRKLDQREQDLIRKLLENEFDGRDAFLTQIDSVLGKETIPGEFIHLRCTAGDPGPKGPSLIAEGECHDADGALLGVLLHCDKDGFLGVLETIRYDGNPIQRQPQASDVNIVSTPRYWPGRLRDEGPISN